MNEEIELVRDCSATAIPAGTAVTLPKGETVFVSQTLGGNVTVRTNQGLFQIAAFDRDALGEGFEHQTETDEAAHSEEFSKDAVWDAMKSCFDPEIPVNIVDLGLIYDLSAEKLDSGKYNVSIKMTLTAQGCGMGPAIAGDAKSKIERLSSVESADVSIVWDPVWNPQMISEEGKKALGLT
ncbi:MAG: putative Fe-S cluster assembly protein SufT [Opitutaceae bacterium]|nr:putative Fe-S cluster assembly protein SufT [Opitutaceae bacterium]